MEAGRSVTINFLLAVGLLALTPPNPGFAEGSRSAGSQNPMRVTTEQNVVSIYVEDSILLCYRYENVPFKPYVQQFFSPRRFNILCDAPPDHLHHHGLMFAVTVDGVNFWKEHQAPGRQVHRCLTDVRIDKHNNVPRASFVEHIHWVNPHSQELLLKEHRTIEVWQAKVPAASLVTWQSKLEVPAGKESVTLTGAHYHGLGMRFSKSMDSGGQFHNADQKTGDIVRGDERLVRSSWCAYTAKANGKPVTVAMFDHPQNLRHPATWFTMTKPFAYLSATLNLHKQPLQLTSGKPLLLQYAVAVWDGRVETGQIDQLYQLWSAVPVRRHVPPSQMAHRGCEPPVALCFCDKQVQQMAIEQY